MSRDFSFFCQGTNHSIHLEDLGGFKGNVGYLRLLQASRLDGPMKTRADLRPLDQCFVRFSKRPFQKN